MNIKPLGDRVVIKKLEAEEKTKAALFFRHKQRTTSNRRSCCGRPWRNRRWKRSEDGSKSRRSRYLFKICGDGNQI